MKDLKKDIKSAWVDYKNGLESILKKNPRYLSPDFWKNGNELTQYDNISSLRDKFELHIYVCKQQVLASLREKYPSVIKERKGRVDNQVELFIREISVFDKVKYWIKSNKSA